MNEMIQIGPQDYMSKLKAHVEVASNDSALALRHAQEFQITTDDDLRVAKEDFVAYREKMKAIEDDRKVITVPLNDILDQVNSLFKNPAENWKAARALLERKGADYAQKKEQERLKLEREAQERARKEEERIRKEKEAQERAWREKEEAKRKEAEELARKALETKNAAKRAELEAQAEKMRQEAARAQDKANERAQQAAEAYVPAETIEKTEVKVAGAKKVVRYYAKVIDPAVVPVEWNGRMIRPVDEGVLGDIARALKSNQSPIPGVKFWSEEKMA